MSKPQENSRQFIDAMREAGIETDCEIIADGKLHRFHVNGDSPRSENGWYVLYDDEILAGAFGCWKRGISLSWCAKSESSLSGEERELYKRRMEESRKQRSEAQKIIHAECRRLSKEIWDNATPAIDDTPYLKLKGVKAYDVRILKDSLLVPVKDLSGVLHGIQFISPDGVKKFKSGTSKTGNFHPFGKSREKTILICEGYATGASLHEATGHAVAVAFDAGNLKPVALQLRKKYPEHKLVICADNDTATEGNPGLRNATEAANAVSGFLAVPQFDVNGDDAAEKGVGKPTDFNDLYKLQGLDAVKNQVSKAKAMSGEETRKKEWLEPQPLIRTIEKGEEFPVDCLPHNMQRAAVRMGEVIKAPMAIICQSLLAAATLATQAHADIINDGRRKPISNNFITIGETGERKSACDDIANLPIMEKQRQLKEQSVTEKASVENEAAVWKKIREQILNGKQYSTKEAKGQALAELGKPPEYIDPMFLTEEPTYEGLIKGFCFGRPSMGLYSDEGGRFLGGYAMSGENITKTISGLCKIWDGSPITRTRAEDGNHLIYGRRLSMHLMIQPIIASQFFSNPMLSGQGFMSRCLCSFPETNIGNRSYVRAILVEDAALAGYFENMKYLMDLPLPMHSEKEMGLQPRIISLDPSAKDLWVQFHDHVEFLQKEGSAFFSIRGFASKSAEHALRIAAVLSAYNDPEASEVTKGLMEAGIEITQFYLGETLRLFHSASDDPDLLLAHKVLQWAQQQGSLLALVDLYQLGPNAVRDKGKALRMLDILENHNWVRKVPKGCTVNGIHRRDVWEVRDVSIS